MSVNHICMRKIGMGQVKLGTNQIVATTFLWCSKLQVVNTKKEDGIYTHLIGYGDSQLKTWNKAQHKLFEGLQTIPSNIYEYRSTQEMEAGTELTPHEIFAVNSYIDVSATTKGRGFTGVMKRWGFSGLGASHGVSKAHRKGGSTGQRTYPGRVFKGKKMPGRYGGERVTIQNIKVVFAEPYQIQGLDGSLLGIQGAVPGPTNSLCFLRRAIKKYPREEVSYEG